jgi:hypothetical protein
VKDEEKKEEKGEIREASASVTLGGGCSFTSVARWSREAFTIFARPEFPHIPASTTFYSFLIFTFLNPTEQTLPPLSQSTSTTSKPRAWPLCRKDARQEARPPGGRPGQLDCRRKEGTTSQ